MLSMDRSATECCDRIRIRRIGLRHGVVVDEPHNAQMCARLLPVPISLTLASCAPMDQASHTSSLWIRAQRPEEGKLASKSCPECQRYNTSEAAARPVVRACVRARACACVHACACVRAWYTLPRCARTIVHLCVLTNVLLTLSGRVSNQLNRVYRLEQVGRLVPTVSECCCGAQRSAAQRTHRPDGSLSVKYRITAGLM
jgi:hypothetical protein